MKILVQLIRTGLGLKLIFGDFWSPRPAPINRKIFTGAKVYAFKSSAKDFKYDIWEEVFSNGKINKSYEKRLHDFYHKRY